VYEERATHLVQSGRQSPAILDRLALRSRAREDKRSYYEDILNKELNALDDQFTSLRYLRDELQVRARGLRVQKKAA